MSRRVRVNSGYSSVYLPDGFSYTGEVEVVLTDAQYAALPSALVSRGIVTDRGAVSDPPPPDASGPSGPVTASWVSVNPVGNLAATDVQAALAELDAEKATPAQVAAAVSGLVNGAPGTLDTLSELATQLTNDESIATTLATLVGTKMAIVSHGATAGTVRPTSTNPLLWVGTVIPTNAVSRDLWLDEATFSLKRYSGTAWNLMAPGMLDYAEMLSDATVTTNATWQVIPGGLLISPASVNRDVILELSGVAVSHTSTQASASFHLGIWDVTAGVAKAARTIDYPTAARWATCPTVRYRLPAGSAAHSYQAAVFAGTTGTFTARTSSGLGWLFTAIQV